MGVGFDYSLYFLKQAAGTWTERANFGVQSIFLRTPFLGSLTAEGCFYLRPTTRPC
jgi:hypothetical protein